MQNFPKFCLKYPDESLQYRYSGIRVIISDLRQPCLEISERAYQTSKKNNQNFPYIYQFAYGPTTDRNESRVLSGELFKYLYFQRLEILCWGSRKLGELREIASPRRRQCAERCFGRGKYQRASLFLQKMEAESAHRSIDGQ